MSKQVITVGGIAIQLATPALACNPPEATTVEVSATGISTLDGKKKTMALLVPTQACRTPEEMAAYVAHNAYLVP